MEDTIMDLSEPLEEDELLKKHQLNEMRRLIADQPDVNVLSKEDWYLVRFLRYRNYNAETALRQVQCYEAFRNQAPNWLDFSPPRISLSQTSGVVHILSKRTPSDCRGLCVRVGKWQPEIMSVDELLKICGIIAEAAALEPRSQVAGVVAVFDMTGLGFTQLRALTPSFAHRMVTYLSSSFPLRLNGIHVLHEPMLFSMVYSLFKGLLDDRMRRRIFFHGNNMDTLHEHVPADVLPVDMGGGTLVPADPLWWKNWLNSDYMLSEMKKRNFNIVDVPS